MTLAVVLQVRDERLQVLLWQRSLAPFARRWALPGGLVDVASGLRRLATGVTRSRRG